MDKSAYQDDLKNWNKWGHYLGSKYERTPREDVQTLCREGDSQRKLLEGKRILETR
jgi:hypothetical protein